jgi:hypothetical protein
MSGILKRCYEWRTTESNPSRANTCCRIEITLPSSRAEKRINPALNVANAFLVADDPVDHGELPQLRTHRAPNRPDQGAPRPPEKILTLHSSLRHTSILGSRVSEFPEFQDRGENFSDFAIGLHKASQSQHSPIRKELKS